MIIRETELNEEVLALLIALSNDWAAEESCYGYRANERADIEGNRIFLAEDDGRIIGYLFGSMALSERMNSIMPDGTAYFEIEELYVIPECRSRGVGAKLFRYAESVVKNKADFIMLGTATKNYKAILHFYLDEVGMEFWSARLFKRIKTDEIR